MQKLERASITETSDEQSRHAGRFDIGSQSASTVNNVIRDQYNHHHQHSHHSDNPYAFVKGIGKVIFGIGMLVFFAGFTAFAYLVISFLLEIFSAIQSETYVDPNLSSIPFVPVLPIAMGLAIAGIALSQLGMFLSGGRNGGMRR